MFCGQTHEHGEPAMITLYGFGRIFRPVIGETRDLRTQWALEETGLPYRVHGLDHTGGELDDPAYSRINCFRLVPAIDDDGFVVAESAAVLLYLAEKAGKLIPSDFEGRMQVTQWCFAALNTVERPLLEIQLIDKFGGTAERRAEMVKTAGRWFDGLERRLDGREWIACADFTVADILLATVLREIRKTDLIDPYPRLKAYYERALARPAWQRTLSLYAERLGVTVADIR
jgi:glutathione S-transferase